MDQQAKQPSAVDRLLAAGLIDQSDLTGRSQLDVDTVAIDLGDLGH